MSTDKDAAIDNAIAQLAAIEGRVVYARQRNLTTGRSFDQQVADVVQLITATEVVRQLDKLVRAAS